MAIAAVVIGALVAAGVIAMTPRGPAPTLAEQGRVVPAAAATPPAAPTGLAFGVEDVAFQNGIEMSLLATR